MKYKDILKYPKALELCGHSSEECIFIDTVHSERARCLLPYLTNNCNVIDLGCGSSIFFLKLLEIYPDIVPWGVDKSLEAIDFSKSILPEFKNNFIHMNIWDISNLERNKFDIVLCSIQLLKDMPLKVLDWIVNDNKTFLYQHYLPKVFKKTSDLVLNIGYSSWDLNSKTVRILSKIDRKSLITSSILESEFNIPSFDFGYMQSVFERFYAPEYAYSFIQTKELKAIAKLYGSSIKDLFVIETF